jgi:hypothetical protein
MMNQKWRKQGLATTDFTQGEPCMPLLFKRPTRHTEAISNITERRQSCKQVALAIAFVPIRRNHNDQLLMRPREQAARVGPHASFPLL